MRAEEEYKKLVVVICQRYDATSGQMFGKKCIKIEGKAGIALFKDYIVFKLPKSMLEEALCLEGSSLWDPSGKGRAMKEWVQIPMEHHDTFQTFAAAASEYVS